MTARTKPASEPAFARSRSGARGTATRGRSAASGSARAQCRPVMIGYVRVSTARQTDSGLGLAAQEAKIRDAAERAGWDVELRADRGKSGAKINPAMRGALDDLTAGLADGLVVAKMDRLARSIQHAAEIMNRARAQGWNLIVLDLGLDLSTPQGRAMANMLATFAEFERDMISVRTREAMSAAKARGARYGRPRLVSTPLVRRIVCARDDGASYGAIARELTAEGIPSPTGRPAWQEATVRRIYTSATEKGAA
jgi:DNA invertase Pin-like site-specific DNA recombinase